MAEQVERWRDAQSYERRYWRERDQQIRTGETEDLSWYRWRADRLADWLETVYPDTPTPCSTVLEIGNGPVGIISYISRGTRIGLDPLERFFQERQHLTSARTPGTHYLAGQGEKIPLPDNSCDLVIVDNCIDHVNQPGVVLAEIRRVIRPNGRLYISVNTRTRPGYLVHRALSRLEIDPGHPHTFTKPGFLHFLEKNGFSVLADRSTSYLTALKREVQDAPLPGLVKGITGITEMPVEALAAPS